MSIELKLKDGHTLTKASTAVLTEECKVCGQHLRKDQIVACFDRPYHFVIHWKCLPYMTLDGRYPHSYPLDHYRNNE